MAFIQNNLSNYSVCQLCSALKFPRSTYYKALVRVPSNKQKVYEEFGRKVKQTYDDSKQRYGAVKICHALNDNGTPCSVKRVQRHMAEQGLRSIVVKKYNHHANHGSIPDDKKNILGRDFGTDTINQKWCTDITYIHVQKEGWTYLASVMDLCSRKIIGYAYGTSMTAELAVKAVILINLFFLSKPKRYTYPLSFIISASVRCPLIVGCQLLHFGCKIPPTRILPLISPLSK